MKKIVLLLLCLCCLVSIPVFPRQISERDAELLLEKMKKDPRYKSAMEEEAASAIQKFPAPDTRLMGALPQTPAGEGPMSAYLKSLYTAYKTKLPVSAVNAANAAMGKLEADADKMSVAATAQWYGGSQASAILLSIQAGVKQPGDPLILNNLAAMLNMGDAAYHALPILRSLVNRYPENPMLLNNLGQSYAGVGQLDSAMRYFNRCLKKSPHHPEANNTAGQIEKSRGNNAKATKHFQDAIRAAHHAEALNGLDELSGGEGYKLLPPMGSPLDLPYFDEFKYKLPRQCSGPADAPYIKQEHEDFVNFLSKMSTAYHAMAQEEQRKGDEQLQKDQARVQQQIAAALKNGGFNYKAFMPGGPFMYGAMRKMMDIGLQMQQEDAIHRQQMEQLEETLKRLLRQYDTALLQLENEYADKMAQYDCGEGRGADCAAIQRLGKEWCQKRVALGNNWQQRLSAAKLDIQQERLRFLRWELNTVAYYGYLSALNKSLGNATYLKAAARYLSQLKALAYNPIVVAGGRCDDQVNNPASKEASDQIKTMDCPIDISVPFVVGKLELNCERFSFSAGEGVIFKVEKNFITKNSTISISAGLQFEGSKEWGIFSGEASASATQSFFITWDKDNNISDAGIAFTAEAGVKAASEIKTPGEIGKDYLQEFQKELGHKAEFGYTLGINSGWTFNDGYLTGLVKSIGIIK